MGTNIRLSAPFQLALDPLDELLGPSDRPGSNLDCALAHAKAGRPVFPCRPDNKRPLTDHGFKDATCDLDQIRAWWRQWPDAMPGLPMGRASGLAALDLDKRPDKDGIAALRDLGLDPDTLSPCIVATPSGGRHLYFRWQEGLGNSADHLPEGVDVRGEGGYVIAPGATGEAGAYSIASPAPDDLPEWPEALRRDAPAPVAKDPLAELLGGDDAKPSPSWHPDHVRSALAFVPADLPHEDGWRQVSMAIHHASGGSDEGFRIWYEWSQTAPDSAKDMNKGGDRAWRAKWKSFIQTPNDRRAPITIRTLYAMANDRGWCRGITDDDFDDLPAPWEEDLADLLGTSTPELVDLDDEKSNALPGTSQSAVYDSSLTFLSPAECAQSEPRPYIVKGLIAARDVACIVGAPGAGKSVLAPTLAYAVAQGREAHGRRTKSGRVFYIAAEDEHGMRGRVTALRAEHGDAENFTLVGGVSDLLKEAVAGQGSPNFNALLKAVEQQRPSLIVIDTLSMSFPGLEENSAEGMGRVVHVARALTKWGAAVILIHHDTKDGQQGLPRGHGLLNGALDVSIHLRKEDDGTVRGRLTKNRNGACDAQLAFSIRGVEIGRDEDGDTVTAPLCVPLNPNGLKTGPRLAPSERAAFESIRAMMGDGNTLDLATWREAAREDLRISAADNPESRRKSIYRALQGLLRAEMVQVTDGTIHFDDGIEWQFDDLPEIGREAAE